MKTLLKASLMLIPLLAIFSVVGATTPPQDDNMNVINFKAPKPKVKDENSNKQILMKFAIYEVTLNSKKVLNTQTSFLPDGARSSDVENYLSTLGTITASTYSQVTTLNDVSIPFKVTNSVLQATYANGNRNLITAVFQPKIIKGQEIQMAFEFNVVNGNLLPQYDPNQKASAHYKQYYKSLEVDSGKSLIISELPESTAQEGEAQDKEFVVTVETELVEPAITN